MLQSHLFLKTLKENPKDEVSVNAQLLERGGFVYKNSAGVYSFLPLGWRVLQNIARIIREEMDAIGARELFMPALVEKKYWDATGRWDVEIGFEVKGKKVAFYAYNDKGIPPGFHGEATANEPGIAKMDTETELYLLQALRHIARISDEGI